MTIDEKWKKVRCFYEKNYKGVHFVEKPSDSKVEFLYQEMNKLLTSWADHHSQVRKSIIRLVRS